MYTVKTLPNSIMVRFKNSHNHLDFEYNVSSVLLGFFPPMQPLMIMDYLGLEQLTAGFGFVTMLKGPAAIIGPPFAGLGKLQLWKS